MIILMELELDRDELRAIARDLGRTKGAADKEEAKIYLAELVARCLDELVFTRLDNPVLDRADAANRRGRQECVVERGKLVRVARSCGQAALADRSKPMGKPRRLRDVTVFARAKAIPHGVLEAQ